MTQHRRPLRRTVQATAASLIAILGLSGCVAFAAADLAADVVQTGVKVTGEVAEGAYNVGKAVVTDDDDDEEDAPE